MVNLSSAFESLRKGVKSGDPRYKIMDDHHVYDTETELKYHLYGGKPFEVSLEGETLITGSHMTNTEAKILAEVKELVKQAYVNGQRNLVHEIWLGKSDEDNLTGMNGGLG